MKLYLHYENGVCGPNFTIKCSVDENADSIIDVLTIFSKAYEKQADGKELKSFSKCLDGDDIFLHYKIVEKKSLESNPLVAVSSDRINIIPDGQSLKTVATIPVAGAVRSTLFARTEAEKLKIREEAQKLVASRSYKKALHLSERYLTGELPNDPVLLKIQIETYLTIDQHDLAVDAAERNATTWPDDAFSHFLLGKSYVSAGRLEEAETAFLKAASTYKKKGGNFSKTFLLDVLAAKAECIFDLNRHAEAADIVNGSLSLPGGDAHVPTLLAYASFALKYDKVEEPVQALVKAITIDQKNKRLRATLAKALNTDAGLDQLFRQVPVSPGASSAFAFLSTVTRDNSALRPALELLKRASSLRPDYALYALNAAHIHENLNDLPGALSCIHSFLTTNASLKVGTWGYSCGELAQLVALALEASTHRAAHGAASSLASPTMFLKWVSSGDDYCESELIPGATPVTATAILKPTSSPVVDKSSEAYSDDDLELLAIGFTVVKVMYCLGRLALIPLVVALIEPTRRRSLTPLHHTLIRNEHARSEERV